MVPEGVNPPVTAAANPPAGTTDLDSVTPDTLLITVTGADAAALNFYNGPVVYTPVQTILDPCALISGSNLIDAADGGTFGSFPQGTPANTGAPAEPYPGVTPDFTYVLPNPAVYAPFGGEYTVQNIMNNSMSAQIGAWWRIADHTQGNETGRMMIVNGSDPGAVFFRDEVSVQPNTNYLFTAWILNLFKVTGYPNPELGVRVVDQNGAVFYSATLGTLIPVNVNAPEVIGNDYAIDDISFNEIQIPSFIPVKTADRPAVNIGETVTYTVTLANTCASPLTDLFFQDIVPDGFSFVPNSVTVNGTTAPGADPNAGFELPDVPGGETVTVTFEALAESIPDPNPALNTAAIDYSYKPVQGGIPGEFSVTTNETPVAVNALADLSVVKSAAPSPAEPGNALTYTITVSNAGPSPAVEAILTDDIPSVLTNVQFSVNGGATYLPWNGSYALGTLAANESRTILIRGILSASAAGQVSNTAVVGSGTPDPNPGNNTSSVITPVIPGENSADLYVVKTSSPNPVRPGGLLTYTITVFNYGPDDADNVVLTDNVPPLLSNVEFSVNGGSNWQPWTGIYNFGTLAPQESVYIFIRGTVSAAAGGSIVNTSVVTGDTADPDPTNNSSDAETPIQADTGADLSIRKTACLSLQDCCRELTYTLAVSNAGPATAERTVVYDDLPAELLRPQYCLNNGMALRPWTGSLDLGSLAPGGSVCIKITGIVSECACGCIENTAEVSALTADPDPSNNTDTVSVKL